MMNTQSVLRLALMTSLLGAGQLLSAAAPGRSLPEKAPGSAVLTLTNGRATYAISIRDSTLVGDTLELSASPDGTLHAAKAGTDAGFSFEIMWTDWAAPGKKNNAENPVLLGPKDFRLRSGTMHALGGGGQEAQLTFFAREYQLMLLATYRLDSGAFYVRRKLALSDSMARGHFLQFVTSRYVVSGKGAQVCHEGGFGQPIALCSQHSGMFFGVEYPAADNTVVHDAGGTITISCKQEMGERIMSEPVESSWTVFGIAPDTLVKYWFFEYLDRCRVSPLTPYALYNSWYDLRAPEMVKDSLHVMNEANALRMVRLLQENMVRKHNIHLDAFVLDDGWDVYRSDWVLRSKEFPRGLRPVADTLAQMGTNLGIWFGPIGGYSHRDWRAGWMKEHGYEVIGDQLCLAGTHYSALFRTRTTDFVEHEGVRYFKWDGIQFSCSDPSHGHPVGIFSRRAVMESVADKCARVRAASPDVFLNITSGTWLSPWWLRYANQIWMQGEDYGYADVPSFSKRDAAMTYRDMVLYDDLRRQENWFPVANLMTHGIIKGNLERLGSMEEPLEKFTDDVLLYFARGISMYELYISPDLLTEGEWNAISESLLWARDRFGVLRHTAMIGGDPGKRQPYGYVHWKGSHGIVAARNPWIDRSALRIRFDEADGLDVHAANLVLERVYPSRWISPKLFKAGDKAELPLEGFETAVYEVYPLAEATDPLVAGVRFDQQVLDGGRNAIMAYEGRPILLNPARVSAISVAGVSAEPSALGGDMAQVASPLFSADVKPGKGGATIAVDIAPAVRAATIAVLVKPEADCAGKELPRCSVALDGTPVNPGGETEKGAWQWYTVEARPGSHTVVLTLPGEAHWRGAVSAWLLTVQGCKGKEIICTALNTPQARPLPPRPWPADEVHRISALGRCVVVQ